MATEKKNDPQHQETTGHWSQGMYLGYVHLVKLHFFPCHLLGGKSISEEILSSLTLVRVVNIKNVERFKTYVNCL